MFARLLLIPAATMYLAAGAQARPASFDCTKARSATEKTICASPELSRLDAALASAYSAAWRKLDAAGRKALGASQKEFLALRDLGDVAQDFDLKQHLQRRADFLKTITAAPKDWSGAWGNDYGSFTFRARSDGRFDVKGEANDPAAGRWTCQIDHGGLLRGAVMKTVHRSKAEADEDPYDGWTLELRRSGASLAVTSIAPAGATGPSAFCGVHGSFDGVYFPVRDP